MAAVEATGLGAPAVALHASTPALAFGSARAAARAAGGGMAGDPRTSAGARAAGSAWIHGGEAVARAAEASPE